MTTTPAPGADLATDELPKLPAPFGCIDIYEDSGIVRSVDGFTAAQMRGYAIDYVTQLGRASLAAVPASEAVAVVTGSTVQWLPGAGTLKDRTELYAAPAPVSGMPDLASLPKYERFTRGGERIGAPSEYFYAVADVERLLKPTGEME